MKIEFATSQEVAEDVTGLRVPGAGHWIPEEQPEAVVAAILELMKAGRSQTVSGEWFCSSWLVLDAATSQQH